MQPLASTTAGGEFEVGQVFWIILPEIFELLEDLLVEGSRELFLFGRFRFVVLALVVGRYSSIEGSQGHRNVRIGVVVV